MNIKEFANIFSDDVIDEIRAIYFEENHYVMKPKYSHPEVSIEYVVFGNKVSIEIVNIVKSYEISKRQLEIYFKIKTQWENYVSNKISCKSAFNELMEADEIFKHLEKMCEVTE